jgi:hypothetical protein
MSATGIMFQNQRLDSASKGKDLMRFPDGTLIWSDEASNPRGLQRNLINRLCCPHKLVFSLLVSCIFNTADASRTEQKREIKAIGCFANVRSDGEHAYGYSVRLWARGMEIIGVIDYHQGLLADPPMGVLTDVQYDPATGKISFEAKLTSGLHYCREHKGVPSQDLLSFQGFLGADGLEGDIVLKDQLDSPPVVVDRRENFLTRIDDDCRL